MPHARHFFTRNATQIGLWLLWLLVLHTDVAVATQLQDQQQQQHAKHSSVTPSLHSQQHSRALLADTELYCNVTSRCKPCRSEHLDSDACRPTAYTEHLMCSTNKSHQHETTLTVHHQVEPRSTLMHGVRSCRAPAELATTSKASDSSSSSSSSSDSSSDSSSSSSNGSTQEVSLSEQVMQHDSNSSADSRVGHTAVSADAAAVHLFPLSAVGGLNLLYFELAMLIILSGALPVVYVRKQRYVRL